jgi:antitoxin component of MazEF toxin-antitoxin module
MKLHRITSAGNSAAITLSADELFYMGAQRGDQVIIQKAKPDRLIIKLKRIEGGRAKLRPP